MLSIIKSFHMIITLSAVVRNGDIQSITSSSFSFPFYLRKGNDNPSRLSMENSTMTGYFYYASIQTLLHRFEAIDANQWTPTLESLNNSFHSLHSFSNNTLELLF